MKATLTIDGIAFSLGAAVVEVVLDELIKINRGDTILNDLIRIVRGDIDPGWEQVLARLAAHPDPAIRSLVCRAILVPLSVLRQLVEDQDILVIEALITDSDRRRLLKAEDFRALGLDLSLRCLSFVDEGHIKRWLSWPCSRLHLTMAENIGKFNEDCASLMADELVAHPSYRVRAVFAGNPQHCQRLVEDQDQGVRAIAVRTLEDMAFRADLCDDDEDGEEG